MSKVLAEVPEDALDWSLLSWFDATSPVFGGQKPSELVATDPERVANHCARVEGIGWHGESREHLRLHPRAKEEKLPGPCDDCRYSETSQNATEELRMRRILACLMVICALTGGCSDDGSDASKDGGDGGNAADAGRDASQASNDDAGKKPGKDAGEAADKDSGADASSDPDEDASADTDAALDGGDDHLANQVVGATGATVTASNGVTLEIPAGALSSNVTITVDELSDVEAPANATSVGKTIALGPEGLTFDMPVKVTLPWDGGDVPVVIIRSPKSSSVWTTLTDVDHDATHVWGYTTGFSKFMPVYYQGAADAPIVLDNDDPIWPTALPTGEAADASLRGTGFRTDTVVTLFKDGVTTAAVSPVTLTQYGLEFTIPTAFTDTVGLITVQAKNPLAEVGDATATYAIETPVLSDLSPSSISVTDTGGGSYVVGPNTVTVTATKLPADLSLCRVSVSKDVGGGLSAGAQVSSPTAVSGGFSFSVSDVQFVGAHDVDLLCGAAVSNQLSLDLILVAP